MVKLGRHGKATAMPSYIQHPAESDLQYQKRKVDEEEGQKKKWKQSLADKEVVLPMIKFVHLFVSQV